MNQNTQDKNDIFGHGKLTRRTALRATGVTMALPWLSAMAPSTALSARSHHKNIGASPRRFVAMTLTLGLLSRNLNPVNSGFNYKPSKYLKPLMDIKNQFTVISGSSHPGVNGGHRSEISTLTANPAAPIGMGANSISIDQVLAQKKGLETRYQSLALSNSDDMSPSYTDSGSMIPAENSPARLFMQLFIDNTPQERKKQIARVRQGRSVMDMVQSDTKKLMSQVSSGDREQLDRYFTSLRELEQVMAENENWINRPKPKVKRQQPKDVSSLHDFIARQRLMSQMMTLALQTDSTRYITFNLGGTKTSKVPIKGIDQGYHPLSHHGHNEDKLRQLALLESEIVKAWGDFIRELRSIKDKNGNLLDQTAVLLTSNLGDASSHKTTNMPVLLAGGGFKHGQHLAFDQNNNYPLTNLFVSLLQRHGVEMDQFSTGKGTMRGLEMV